jgi:hypothetical protein
MYIGARATSASIIERFATAPALLLPPLPSAFFLLLYCAQSGPNRVKRCAVSINSVRSDRLAALIMPASPFFCPLEALHGRPPPYRHFDDLGAVVQDHENRYSSHSLLLLG